MLIILHSDIDKVEEAFKELEAELDIKLIKNKHICKNKENAILIESITNKDLFELKKYFLNIIIFQKHLKT